MAEYSTLKVPELKKLLADKKLPQTGNKADLIARLQDDNVKNSKSTATTGSTVAQPAPAVAQPAPAVAQPAPAVAQPATELSVAQGEEPKSETAPVDPAQSFAMGLSKTAADAEAKKRADRAKRFGIDEDEDAKRRAERAKRFGIDESELATGLDSALPGKSLKRGRGRGGDDDARSGKRQNGGDRQGRNQRNGRATRQDGNKGPAKRGGIMDDPSEKAKAEKRAARFA
ncbi:DNA-binding SAP [Ophiocordyceps sinensis CO18]|uniref:DNA-binding SAP n=1 Tax=Ophiocordyceps sinensis (strain Co18 / CGMCC 3.14243) TaxID=911162 RepID=T5ACZ8_OPHSC|nr:DNA-binding SAP [Ophiocordyceps sinensis CO18]